MKYLLAIDVGNTVSAIGLFNGKNLVTSWYIATVRQRSADELYIILEEFFRLRKIDTKDITAMAISCVVPPVSRALEELVKKYFTSKCLVVGPGIKTGIAIKYDDPREVGADRIANSVAAYEKYGGPVIVIDFGTATTFDVISRKGEYLGGVIAPGVEISSDALFEKAARLPRVEIVKPKRVIGQDTATSIQSGLIYGFAGQINEIVKRISEELELKPKIIVTGGLATLITSELEIAHELDPLLTLEGLRLIYEKNVD
jgi:type III pantothenate kinase